MHGAQVVHVFILTFEHIQVVLQLHKSCYRDKQSENAQNNTHQHKTLQRRPQKMQHQIIFLPHGQVLNYRLLRLVLWTKRVVGHCSRGQRSDYGLPSLCRSKTSPLKRFFVAQIFYQSRLLDNWSFTLSHGPRLKSASANHKARAEKMLIFL